jgi:hypothetical protein
MTAILTERDQLRAELTDILRRELLCSIIESATRPSPETLFTRAQTAKKLGKSKNTIQRMINDNRLTTTTDGKYISQQSINEYLNQRP